MSEMAAQRSALAAARRLRAEYLVAVVEGHVDPFDIFRIAENASHRALRAITLEGAFSSAGMSPTRWTSVKTRLLTSLDLPPKTPDAQLTVGWLLDPRAGGRRWYALHDAMRSRDEAPWEEFLWL